MLLAYLLAIFSLAFGSFGIWGALTPGIPVPLLYWHGKLRKPVAWAILGILCLWLVWSHLGISAPITLTIAILGTVMAHRAHQSHVFRAIDFPEHTTASHLPLTDDMDIALVEVNGETRAYALDHLIHHHIINDRIGGQIISVTYCAMCRSIIPYDVTKIGPLYVGSYKNANMVLADRKTGTFFQQASAESMIGPLHPSTLEMVTYQILTWGELRQDPDIPLFTCFTLDDLKPFELPVPGAWKRIMASEVTPGLSAAKRDKSVPARTRVIGLKDPQKPPLAWRLDSLRKAGLISVPEHALFLVAARGSGSAFSNAVLGRPIELTLSDNALTDARTGTLWSLRGKYLSGPLKDDLSLMPTSDEYWFSWKLFHPKAELQS